MKRTLFEQQMHDETIRTIPATQHGWVVLMLQTLCAGLEQTWQKALVRVAAICQEAWFAENRKQDEPAQTYLQTYTPYTPAEMVADEEALQNFEQTHMDIADIRVSDIVNLAKDTHSPRIRTLLDFLRKAWPERDCRVGTLWATRDELGNLMLKVPLRFSVKDTQFQELREIMQLACTKAAQTRLTALRLKNKRKAKKSSGKG